MKALLMALVVLSMMVHPAAAQTTSATNPCLITHCNCNLPSYGCLNTACRMVCIKCCATKSISTGITMEISNKMEGSSIPLALMTAQKLSIRLYDVTGRLVQVVSDNYFFPGGYKIPLTVAELGNGIYTLSIVGADVTETRQLIVM
jgi:hypothetical protein